MSSTGRLSATFQFGAIVNRSPLVVGISTDGAAPVLGQAIRSRIEALLPAGLARWAARAKAWRERHRQAAAHGLRSAGGSGSGSRRAPSPRRIAPRTRASASTLLQRPTTTAQAGSARGRVTLVGAGPGNPELLTLRAVRALRSADVILFDDLVAPEILDFARREAKRMLVGKTGHEPSCKQDDINALMLSLAKAGKRVVRLKARRPDDLRPRGRGDRRAASARASRSRWCRASPRRRARRRASRFR